MTPPNTRSTTHTGVQFATMFIPLRSEGQDAVVNIATKHGERRLVKMTYLHFMDFCTQHTQRGAAECAKRLNKKTKKQ
jgi:hypothetical protein